MEEAHVSLESSDKFDRLVLWMARYGFTGEKCCLIPKEFPTTGRGLAATRTIMAGDAIIEVPRSLIVTSRTVMDSYLKRHIKRAMLTPLAAICLFLVCEKLRGSKSPWCEYVTSLPITYTVPAYWSEDLIQRLPAAIKQSVLDQRKRVHDLFKESKSVFASVSKASADFRKHSFTMDDFMWAWSTVNTRCVYWIQKDNPDLKKDGEDHYALVPLLDLLNHSYQAQVKAGYDEQTASYKIETLSECATDSQVFICYGSHSDIKLLLEYGFILENNPNNVIHITSDEFVDALGDNPKTESLAIICENRLNRGQAISDEGVTWSLLTALKVVALQHIEGAYLNRWSEYLEEKSFASSEHKKVTDELQTVLLRNQLKLWQFEIKDQTDPMEKMVDSLCEQHRRLIENCLPNG